MTYDNNDGPIYSSLTGKPGTGTYCAGLTCGGPGDDSGLDGTWEYFCENDVGGCTWTWNGSVWNITNSCSSLCSCCTCMELNPPNTNLFVGRTWTQPMCVAAN